MLLHAKAELGYSSNLLVLKVRSSYKDRSVNESKRALGHPPQTRPIFASGTGLGGQKPISAGFSGVFLVYEKSRKEVMVERNDGSQAVIHGVPILSCLIQGSVTITLLS